MLAMGWRVTELFVLLKIFWVEFSLDWIKRQKICIEFIVLIPQLSNVWNDNSVHIQMRILSVTQIDFWVGS